MGFLSLNFNFDADDFKDAKFWMGLFREAMGTALWITVNSLLGKSGIWSLGLSYLIVQSAVGGSYNALSSFNNFLNGKDGFFTFVLNLLAQLVGAMGIIYVFNFLGISNVAVSENTAQTISGAFSADGWKTAFFGGEFFGIFLYTVFVAKAKETGGIPDGLWSVFLVTIAQLCGASFFFPANAFVGDFKLFISCAQWTVVLFQLLASFVAQVVLEYLWN